MAPEKSVVEGAAYSQANPRKTATNTSTYNRRTANPVATEFRAGALFVGLRLQDRQVYCNVHYQATLEPSHGRKPKAPVLNADGLVLLLYPLANGKRRRTYTTPAVGPSPRSNSSNVARSMQSNKKAGTKPELLLAKLLRKQIVKSALPGSPDFVYPKERVAIFVDGCFWHRCPICNLGLPRRNTDFWRRKFERNKERDILNRQDLEMMGWRVLDFWEHEIIQDPADCALRVKATLKELR